jgi:DNA-directed RNA polymerase specialized sigma24 family protein
LELLETTLVTNPLESEGLDVQKIFADCSDTERQLLERYYLEGFTSHELSHEFGLSAVGVRVRLTRLKKSIVLRCEHKPLGDELQHAA